MTSMIKLISSKRWALIIGVLTAIAAGITTSAHATSAGDDHLPASGITHEEVVELLAYLWENEEQMTPPVITIYNYELEEIYHGERQYLHDNILVGKTDLLLTDGNHTIYLVE